MLRRGQLKLLAKLEKILANVSMELLPNEASNITLSITSTRVAKDDCISMQLQPPNQGTPEKLPPLLESRKL
jgi:hypothetical protein